MEVFADYLSRIDNPQHLARTEVLCWVGVRFPNLTPKIAWNQPMFTDHGTFIIGFSISKHHLAVAPEKTGIDHFSDEIEKAGFDHTKELVRIPWDGPVPFPLLERMVEFNILDKAGCMAFGGNRNIEKTIDSAIRSCYTFYVDCSFNHYKATRGDFMPRSKEQYEEMRLKSKSAILDAAMHLFVTKGYHATTTGAIAKEAGVAMGLMYHYYKSKEDLLLSIIEEHLDDLFKSAAGQIDFQKTPGLTEVRMIIDALFRAISQRSDSWRLIITIMFQQDVSTDARHMVEGLMMHQNSLYEAYFQGIGALRPKESAHTVTAIIHGAILSFAMSGQTEEFQLVKEHVLEKLLVSGV